MNIYKVEAFFEDFESSYSLIIGLFTDKKLAELVKNKWLDFFTQSKDLLNEPFDWNPKLDQWYNIDYELDWISSYDYNQLVFKYRDIRNFTTVDIDKVPLDKELIFDHFKNSEIENLMKEFDRDFKLNKLLK
jgi:hypothetical protein